MCEIILNIKEYNIQVKKITTRCERNGQK